MAKYNQHSNTIYFRTNAGPKRALYTLAAFLMPWPLASFYMDNYNDAYISLFIILIILYTAFKLSKKENLKIKFHKLYIEIPNTPYFKQDKTLKTSEYINYDQIEQVDIGVIPIPKITHTKYGPTAIEVITNKQNLFILQQDLYSLNCFHHLYKMLTHKTTKQDYNDVEIPQYIGFGGPHILSSPHEELPSQHTSTQNDNSVIKRKEY